MSTLFFEREPEPDAGRSPIWDGHPEYDRRLLDNEPPHPEPSKFKPLGKDEIEPTVCGFCGRTVTKIPHHCIGPQSVGSIHRLDDNSWAMILEATPLPDASVTYFQMPGGRVVTESIDDFLTKEVKPK